MLNCPRDGTELGPNIEATAALARAVELPILASGGVARVLRRHFPKADIEIGPGFTPSNIYDLSRARRELGYSPQFDLERGIADYLERLKRLPSRIA